ncbi:polysaccharide deacetylase [Salsuginibacillus halophilus]|uniref:Polysaccharide deacetylase n=1 Tax=Salsuginibacillus halophilus TaxID=517424 RepID=A0A2P8HQD1_9BACI|nr:polysaccharide deacetylase family protein [Salsuginibacillus halophilus]PSL48417.1 polysaccharide deacetylase [Salsuginibacillus halophilus]
MKYLLPIVGVLIIGALVTYMAVLPSDPPDNEASDQQNGSQDEPGSEDAKAPEDAEHNIPVLMYHDFDTEEENSLTVHPDDFRDQLEALDNAGYETINDQDLIDFKNGDEDALPEQPILITIDDGYVSNYEYAYPILEEMDMQATIYIIVERRDVGADNHFSWEEAREMVESGHIDIQHHTYDSHHYIETEDGEESPVLAARKPEESGEAYEERVREDMALGIKRVEEELGITMNSFTMPYGRSNQTIRDVSEDLGIEMFFTVRAQMNTEEEVKDGLMHRFNVPGGMSSQELIDMLEEHKS